MILSTFHYLVHDSNAAYFLFIPQLQVPVLHKIQIIQFLSA